MPEEMELTSANDRRNRRATSNLTENDTDYMWYMGTKGFYGMTTF